MRRNSIKLDDKIAASLEPPTKGYNLYFDAQVAGFGVRVTAAGARAYVLNYRADGVERRMTIGSVGEWQCTTARNEAKRLKRDVYHGADPLGEKHARRELPTVGELLDLVEVDYFHKLRPSSRSAYSIAIRSIREAFGKRPVTDLTHGDVDAFHARLSRGTPIMANTTLAVFSKALSVAVRRGWAVSNVAKGVERNPGVARERYLSPAELERLSKVLDNWPDRRVANIIRILLLSGARKGEVLSMKWEHLALNEGVWTKPAAVVKQKRIHRIPLSTAAIQLLQSIERTSEWVFPSRDSHLKSLNEPWAAICKACGFTDVRIHDLRHTYASVLIGTGMSLAIVGKLLGHSKPQTTARYAHLADDPLREATERVATALRR